MRAGSAEYQAGIHGGLSVVFGDLGHPDAALEHIRQAVGLARAVGAPLNRYLDWLGYCEVWAGDNDRGLAICRQAAEEDAGGPTYQVHAIRRLGAACLLAGRPAEAISHLRQAVMRSRESDLIYSEAQCLITLGHACLAAADPDTARTAWQQALGRYDKILPGHPDAEQIRAELKHL